MKNKRGSILIATLGFVVVFMLLGIAAINLGGLQNDAAAKQNYSAKAFWLADSGIQMTKKRINADACAYFHQYDAAAGGPCNVGAVCTDCSHCGSKEKCLNDSFTSVINGVTVTTGDYFVVLNKSNTVITSTGTAYSNPTATDRQKRKIKASASPFAYAIFGINSVTLGNNNLVDSYDSSKLKSDGTPCAYGQVCADGQTNINSSGDVGTNGTGTPAINVGSNSNINGDVSTGPGGTASSPYNDSATHDNNIEFPQIVLPGDFAAQNSGGTFTNHAPATLGNGDYRYSDVTGSLNVTGNARLQLTNNVNSMTLGNNASIIIQSGASLTVYAQGGINADANNINLNNANNPAPKNFIYFMYGSSTSPIIIKNTSDVYMSIYAPNASKIEFKNSGEIFGAFIAKSVDFKNNSGIHYDEDLLNYGAGGPGSGTNFQVRFWQEMSN